jgi:GAF domain-containing protein
MPSSKMVSVPGIPKLGEILIENGFLSAKDLETVLQTQEERNARGEKVFLGQLLTDMGMISYSALYNALDTQIRWLSTELEHRYHQTEIITDLSTQILKASNTQELIAILNNHLPAVDHISLLHIFEADSEDTHHAVRRNLPENNIIVSGGVTTNLWGRITREGVKSFLSPGEALILSNGDHPKPLRGIFAKFGEPFGFRSIVFLPIYVLDRLAGFLFIGSREMDLTLQSVQYHQQIAQLTATGLERMAELEAKDRNLKILDTLDRIGQAISLETDLDNLYPIIHHQVTKVMGEVDFIIAIYDSESDTIEIPYAYEDKKAISLPSFPLGEGLTSLLIRNHEPLLLVENTEERARELGAKVIGQPAKSWLGVPLLISGQPTGAIVVQDTRHDHRFNETDQRLLTSLASQVAVAIHNAFLFQKIREKSERERIMADFTSRVWSSPDMETILQNALSELGKNFDVDEGFIELEKPQPEF